MSFSNTTNTALGIPVAYEALYGLSYQPEAAELREVGPDMFGRPARLRPDAALAFLRMQASAAEEGIQLELVSAYRSHAYQAGLIREKLSRGEGIEDILRVNAAPGYSEHHTGCAIDLSTPGCEPLSEAFETTPAFAWLEAGASAFGFWLSYPRNNPNKLVYEPWHWRFKASTPPA